MKRTASLLLLALLASYGLAAGVLAQTTTSDGTVEVSNVAHKVIQGPDAEGDLLISVKAEVKNLLSRPQDVEIWVRALDAEGFEVVDVPLTARLKAGQQKGLTDTLYLNARAYKTIVKWQAEE